MMTKIPNKKFYETFRFGSKITAGFNLSIYKYLRDLEYITICNDK